MRDVDSRTNIQRALSEFEELDRHLIEKIDSKDFDYLETVRAAKNRLKDLLADHASVQFAGRLQSALRRVRTNEGYNIDRLYGLLGPEYSQEVDDRDFIDALFTEGTAAYVDQSFFRRRREVGAVVVSQTLPPHVQRRLKDVSECYALGLSHATIIFCRALVEASIYEALMRRGRIGSRGKVVDQGEFKPADLRQRIRSFVPPKLWDRTCGPDGVTKLADRILHAKHDVRFAERQAYESIKASFALIEHLFS